MKSGVKETVECALSELNRGTSARIISIVGEDLSERRLRHIGFEEDKEVEILHTGPFGRDPIAVRVDNVTLAIRRNDASLIKVKAALRLRKSL